MKRIIFSALVLGFIFFGLNKAHACICQIMSDKKRVKIMKKEADAIFVGTVKSVSWVEDNPIGGKKVVLSVEKSWKAGKIEEYTIHVIGAGGCNVFFEVGKTYLVYANRDKNDFLVTERCSGTREISAVGEDFKFLGKPLFFRNN